MIDSVRYIPLLIEYLDDRNSVRNSTDGAWKGASTYGSE